MLKIAIQYKYNHKCLKTAKHIECTKTNANIISLVIYTHPVKNLEKFRKNHLYLEKNALLTHKNIEAIT